MSHLSESHVTPVCQVLIQEITLFPTLALLEVALETRSEVLDAIAEQVFVNNPCLALLALANVDPDHLGSGKIPIAQSGFDLNNERFFPPPCSETRWRMPYDIERRITL
jgi:hypothetical protein